MRAVAVQETVGVEHKRRARRQFDGGLGPAGAERLHAQRWTDLYLEVAADTVRAEQRGRVPGNAQPRGSVGFDGDIARGDERPAAPSFGFEQSGDHLEDAVIWRSG